MRDICGILGINRSSFYYQPREDPSEAVLRAEIETLAGRYPRYGKAYHTVTPAQGYRWPPTRRSVDERNESLVSSVRVHSLNRFRARNAYQALHRNP